MDPLTIIYFLTLYNWAKVNMIINIYVRINSGIMGKLIAYNNNKR